MKKQQTSRADTHRPYRVALHIHIVSLFALLIVITGSVIGWFNYVQTSKMILGASDLIFDEIQRKVLADLRRGGQLSRTTVDLLANVDFEAANSLEQRLRHLALFRDALRRNDRLSSLYVGYEDGGFFQVVPLRTAQQRRSYNAPETAAVLIWSVEGSNGPEPGSSYLYLDAEWNRMAAEDQPAPSFDPRTRPWYLAALARQHLAVTRPYVFFTLRQVGLTLSRRTVGGAAVVGADVTLASLSELLARYQVSPSAELAITSDTGELLAYVDPQQVLTRAGEDGELGLGRLETLPGGVLAAVARRPAGADGREQLQWQGRSWQTGRQRLKVGEGFHVNLLMAAPEEELVAEAVRIRWQSLLVTGLLILAALPIAWFTSRLLSQPLKRLAGEARSIREFNFEQPLTTRSVILEIDQLARSMDAMKATLSSFLEISETLSSEHQFESLLQRVAGEGMTALDADAGLVLLLDEQDAKLTAAAFLLEAVDGRRHPPTPAEIRISTDGGTDPLSLALAARGTRSADLDRSTPAPLDGLTADLCRELGCDGLRLHALPLRTSRGDVVGLICLFHRARKRDLETLVGGHRLAFAEALAGVAATAIDNQKLFKSQKDLLDALIKLVAGAIDAKSPYTGGHCQRVPAITRMLAEAACRSESPGFRDFQLSPQQWEALDIACWLHDCGKVTTPEYVVDKATKLQTIHDRIHEIRMRFEVLKRDAEIDYWKAVAEGGDIRELRPGLERQHRRLDEEFAFVAACNEGGEFMAPEKIERLRQIGSRPWRRTLNDRLGTCWEERERKGRGPVSLPVTERLLDDKAEHIIARDAEETLAKDNPWGFRLRVPEHKFNLGELYNLSVARGTLTEEERFIINDHIVQTIRMLSSLPFPSHLRDVPEIAGGHHEKMDGTGYPRGLKGSEMSPLAKMMAIADIFEALTASDRPYKKAKTLSEALAIMRHMSESGHIDPLLFELFLEAGVHLDYARRFLASEQIDLAM